MKIISWNLNGIRSAYEKGLLRWMKETKADIFCFQEVRAQEYQIPKELLDLKGYHYYFSSAERGGYSGVGVFTKEEPIKVYNQMGSVKFDSEGRFLRLDFKDFILINFYIPFGGQVKENLFYKLESYKKIFEYIKTIENKNVILVGDFNIAHQEIDLARPKENMDSIMFTQEERQQIDRLLEIGFVDSFRKINGTQMKFSWWSHFANARERNVGWRIDYIFVSNNLSQNLKDAFILNEVYGSDHCPVGIIV